MVRCRASTRASPGKPVVNPATAASMKTVVRGPESTSALVVVETPSLPVRVMSPLRSIARKPSAPRAEYDPGFGRHRVFLFPAQGME
jgi:hypothetical protein